jgi:hypothetical protein
MSINTGSYLGTVVKKIPFTIENPEYGKFPELLPATKELVSKHGTDKVKEIYMGKPMPEWGIVYDGARDVYFGDGRGMPFSGSCTNNGTGLSYGNDLRFQLNIGGEKRRSLIKYDLSMLSKDSKIEKALIALNVYSVNTKADLNCNVFALKKPFHEKDVNIYGGVNVPRARRGAKQPLCPVGKPVMWEKPVFKGETDRYTDPLTTFQFNSKGWMTIDITSAVQKWISGEWVNNGFALEMVKEIMAYGKSDVRTWASDYAVYPSKRPRLILAFSEKPKLVGHTVKEINAGLLKKALTEGSPDKPYLINILSSGSITSRNFEKQVLANADALAWIDQNFTEIRIDMDKKEYGPLLKKLKLKERVPVSIIVGPKDSGGNIHFSKLETYDWDLQGGNMRSDFERVEIFTYRLLKKLELLKYKKKLDFLLAPGVVKDISEAKGGCG